MEQNENRIVKCKIQVIKILFQSFENDFKIFKARMVEGYEEYPSPENNYSFSVKGNCPELDVYKTIYILEAEEYVDDKYGLTYKILSIREDLDINDIESQKNFLKKFLTNKEYISLFSKFDNPLKAIKDGEINSLTEIKGIGPATINKILTKVEDNEGYGNIYMKLKIDLPINLVKSLVKKYSSPDLVVQKIKENPYILSSEVKGIGFKKADEIALSYGIKKNDPKRIQAYIIYALSEIENKDGHLWITMSDLVYNVKNYIETSTVPEIVANIKKMIETKTLYYQSETKKIGLYSYYLLEYKISQEIKRIKNNIIKVPEDWKDSVKNLELTQGWEFNEEQYQAIETALKNPFTVITGSAGCVDCDTEFFNGFQWKKISEYQKDDKVLQYHADGKATLCYPLQYVKKPEKEFTLIQTKSGGINQCLSNEHNVVYLTSKGNLAKKPFYEIKEKHLNSKKGFYGRFITTFDYGGNGINLTDEELRLMIAVMADGHFTDAETTHCSINIKKERKIKRIEKLLIEANINYYHGIRSSGLHFFSFYAPFKLKHFPKEWYNCTHHQLEIISEEVIYWDGSEQKGRTSFFTTSKSDAEFIQFVFSATGYRSVICENDRRGEEKITNNKVYIRKSIDYSVRKIKDKFLRIGARDGREKASMSSYQSKDGFKYCFTVPTNMLVLRREGRIFITGNTGKTSTVAGILYALPGIEFAQCALSGKAANRLTEVTNFEGKTIHRLLEYNPGQGFYYDKNNKLPCELVLLDEGSMVGGDIFLKLLEAVSNNSRLIILGDIDQLDAIGLGSAFKDIIASNTIPTVKLIKIMRQAEKSGIITESQKIAKSVQITENNFHGTKTYGELQDFTVHCEENQNILLEISNCYKNYINKVNSIMDLQFICPMRERGEISCKNINSLIQNLYNPKRIDKNEIVIKGSLGKCNYILREGDKVINRKNNYNTLNTNGEITFIYNGNIGIIEKIEYSSMVINFDEIGRVVINNDFYKNIELAYCITTHLSQGSQFDYVVYAFDMSSYILLNKEQLYTAVSRAKVHCDLYAENKALQLGIKTSKAIIKHTWLKDLLKE